MHASRGAAQPAGQLAANGRTAHRATQPRHASTPERARPAALHAGAQAVRAWGHPVILSLFSAVHFTAADSISLEGSRGGTRRGYMGGQAQLRERTNNCSAGGPRGQGRRPPGAASRRLLLALLRRNPLARGAPRVDGGAGGLEEGGGHEADEGGEGVEGLASHHRHAAGRDVLPLRQARTDAGEGSRRGRGRAVRQASGRQARRQGGQRLRREHGPASHAPPRDALLPALPPPRACMRRKRCTARSHWPPFSQALMSEVKM